METFGCLEPMVRRWASTCFAFMLPKNTVGQVDLFARTEGTARSPVSNKGVSSIFWGLAGGNPNPKYPRTVSPLCGQSESRAPRHS